MAATVIKGDIPRQCGSASYSTSRFLRHSSSPGFICLEAVPPEYRTSMEPSHRNLAQSLGQGDEDRRPGKRPAARGTAFYPRKRANTACQVCRARKTKCDNQKPACSYCLSVGATCIQSPVDLSSFDPASLKILERLDELEKLMREEPRRRSVENESYDDTQSQSPETSGRGVTGDPMPRVGTVYRDSAEREDIALRSILPEKVESLLLWSAFHSQPRRHLSVPSPPVPLTAPSPGNSTLGALLDIEPHGINVLLDNFFAYVHCKNPILEEMATRHLVISTILDGIDWSPKSCLALVICALGRIATPFGPSLDTKPDKAAYTESQVFFQAAQKRIGTLLCQPDIIGPQCLFLSGVYLMCVYQPIYAWRLFSQALAACQHLPFLRRAQNTMASVPGFSADSMEMGDHDTQQQAVYWSAWKSERELRQELLLPDFNMPHSTSVLYPPFFPTPPQLVESMKTTDSDRQRTSWLFYLAEISLRRLSSRVCNEIMELHRSSGSNLAFLSDLALMVPEYESQVRQWSDSLPTELSIQAPPEQDNVCLFVLRGHLENFFETIYWPFMMAHLSLLGCPSPIIPAVTAYAEKGLEVHVRRIHINAPGFLHRHHGTYPMTKSCMRSAVVLLGARKLGVEMPDGWREAVFEVVQLLSVWEDEIPELPEWKGFLEHTVVALGS
ncbi:Fc.00g075420.m01.CDS01 [Cosmosporella sp. VM-42]